MKMITAGFTHTSVMDNLNVSCFNERRSHFKVQEVDGELEAAQVEVESQ